MTINTPAPAGRKTSWAIVLTAALLTAGTVALIWAVAVPWGPFVCPAIYPAPRNCFAENRLASGILATAIVLVVAAITILFAQWRRPRLHAVSFVGIVLLVLAPFAAYIFVAYLP